MEMERVSRLLEHKNRLTIQNNQPTDQPTKQTEWLPNQSNITNQPTDQPTKQEDRFINQTTNQLDNKEANQTTQPDWSTNCPVIQTRRQIKQPANQPTRTEPTDPTNHKSLKMKYKKGVRRFEVPSQSYHIIDQMGSSML